MTSDPRPTSAPRLCECGQPDSAHNYYSDANAGLGCVASGCTEYRPTPLPPLLCPDCRSGGSMDDMLRHAKETGHSPAWASSPPSPVAPDLAALLSAYHEAVFRAGASDEGNAPLGEQTERALECGRIRIALDAALASLTAERDAAVRERDALAEEMEWLDDRRNYLLIRPGVNRIGCSVGGWCWSRVLGGVEELALTFRDAVRSARGFAASRTPTTTGGQTDG